MKQLFIGFTFLCSLSSFANTASVDVVGNFSNKDGCRAYGVNCMVFQTEGDKYNKCSFELYINGEYVNQLGRGKILEANGNRIVAQDKGFRTTMSVPEYVNVTAEMNIKESYKDPTRYTAKSVTRFDLILKEGILNSKIAECSDMVLE